MVGESAAGSNNRSHQEVDLEQLVHARAKNALWRSWSLEGLSEANREEQEPAAAGDRRRPSLKNSPKAWEVFYERFLEDMGESNLAVELARRQHGDADISPGGISVEGGRPSPDDAATAAAAAAAPLAMCEMSGGSDAPVRGGQMFGHFAGGGGGGDGGAFAGPVGHGHGEDYGGHVRAQPRAGWGASELTLGLDMAGSYDPHQHRKWAGESSAGPKEKSAAAAVGEDSADTPIKPSLSDPILGLGIDETPAPERLKLLRKAFTQARNQRRKDVPDDTVSAFLGDDLSVHYNNYFGSLWAGRNSRIGSGASSDTSGGGGGGGPSEPSRWGAFDIAGVAATGGSHVRFVDGGQQQRRWRRGAETGQPSGHAVGGGGGGGGIRGAPFGRSRGMVSLGDLRGADTAASAAAAGMYPSAMGAAEYPRGPEREGSTGALATLFASPPSGQEDAADLSASIAAAVAGTRYVPGMAMQVASSGDEFPARRTTGITPPYELVAAQEEEVIVGSLRPTPPGRKRGGMAARSTSALDKLVNEQDRGQAVMMPLMDWNDWNADRLHWTFPAVVHAFPRCLYDVSGASARRRRRGETRSTTRREGRSDPSAAADAIAAAAAGPVMPPVGVLPEEGSGLLRGIRKAWEIGSRESGGGGGGGVMYGVPGNRSGAQEENKAQQQHAAGARGQGDEGNQGEEAAGGKSGGVPPGFPNPFEPLSLGEVYIRTAPSSELALAGVGAGPWRRRWLVLRQTYMFELLQPPPPSVPTLSLACDSQRGLLPVPLPLSKPLGASSLVRAPVAGSSLTGGGRGGTGVDERGGRPGEGAGPVGAGGGSGGGGEGGGSNVRKTTGRPGAYGEGLEEAVTPVGFLCLSKASVENGGINWGPKTLLLRCESRPSTMSREEISAAASVGVDLAATAAIGGSGRAGRAREEIRVELRLPNDEAGERWAALIRDRATLEMSTLFEPSPSDLEEYAAGVGKESDSNAKSDIDIDTDTDFGFGCEPMGETETGFSVLGQGRYSKVVCAKRKQQWARAGRNVCAIKVVDKQAFWSRVRSGKERVDSLAREVFCQTSLTMEGADGDDDHGSTEATFAAGDSELDPGGDEQEEEKEEREEDCSAERSLRRPSGDEAVAADGTGGGGIVRVHSIMETADDLILEMDLMSRTDLFDRLQELNGAFTERQAAGMARNLLLAIDKINRLGFCHRDVKPANLLYPGPGSSLDPVCVVLADFGMAAKAGRDGLVRGRCGTVGFVAPEILRGGKQEGYGMNVDIFSAGAVLYMCLCGYEPFFGLTDKEIKAANRKAEFAFAEGWEEVSHNAKDLITKMMEPDPAKRITPREALQHPWIVEHNQPTSG